MTESFTHTHFSSFYWNVFFLMAIICLNISISTICNWVFLRNSACPLCWWYLCRFCFVYFFPCCTLAVERLVDNIVEELGLVGVDVVACVGNHLQLDPDPENRCQGDCHAGGQGGAQCTEHWVVVVVVYWAHNILGTTDIYSSHNTCLWLIFRIPKPTFNFDATFLMIVILVDEEKRKCWSFQIQDGCDDGIMIMMVL